MAILTVKLIKVSNLTDGDLVGKSDPYIKLDVEQDNFGPFDKDLGGKKSSVKKDDCNPEYNEDFEFTIPDNVGLSNVYLTCTIMDDDPIKHDKLGKCKINLDTLDLGPEFTGVERVVDKNIFSAHARIYLQIKYTV